MDNYHGLPGLCCEVVASSLEELHHPVILAKPNTVAPDRCSRIQYLSTPIHLMISVGTRTLNP